ncbi:type IV pilin protein [Okeania sp. SIO3B5]|uniref:type IV pilin protein n=1 Tax=Okeania sp. SIO3B5 TaxID=2607811 RepID=UPI0035C89533
MRIMIKNLSRFFLQRSDKQRNNQGVTLIELLIVVVIITILSAIALPSFVKVAKGKVKCYSGTEHCYEFVSRQWTWTKAKVLAEIRSFDILPTLLYETARDSLASLLEAFLFLSTRLPRFTLLGSYSRSTD